MFLCVSTFMRSWKQRKYFPKKALNTCGNKMGTFWIRLDLRQHMQWLMPIFSCIFSNPFTPAVPPDLRRSQGRCPRGAVAFSPAWSVHELACGEGTAAGCEPDFSFLHPVKPCPSWGLCLLAKS